MHYLPSVSKNVFHSFYSEAIATDEEDKKPTDKAHMKGLIFSFS